MEKIQPESAPLLEQATEKGIDLISSEEDETLQDVQFFLHGTSSLIDAGHIQKDGLTVREGRSTLSTDLEHALKWSMGENRHYSESQTERTDNEIGRIIVLGKPNNYMIRYGLFTDAKIGDKEVTGFPVKYASGRKQLAVYQIDAKKEDLEKLTKDEREKITLPPENIEAIIRPSDEMRELITNLSAKVKKLEEVNIADYSQKLVNLLEADKDNEIHCDINDLAQKIIVTTIESIIISKMRNLQLDILAAKGLKIYEKNELQERHIDISKLRNEITSLYNKSHQEDFDTGLKWLNNMIRTKTEYLKEEMGIF